MTATSEYAMDTNLSTSGVVNLTTNNTTRNAHSGSNGSNRSILNQCTTLNGIPYPVMLGLTIVSTYITMAILFSIHQRQKHGSKGSTGIYTSYRRNCSYKKLAVEIFLFLLLIYSVVSTVVNVVLDFIDLANDDGKWICYITIFSSSPNFKSFLTTFIFLPFKMSMSMLNNFINLNTSFYSFCYCLCVNSINICDAPRKWCTRAF